MEKQHIPLRLQTAAELAKKIEWDSLDENQGHAVVQENKRKRDNFDKDEKSKLTHSVVFSEEQDDDFVIFPSGAARVANNFIQILNGDYTLVYNKNAINNLASNNSTDLNISKPLITMTLSLQKFVKISANNLESLYRRVAETLIEDHSVITIIEYLMRQNFAWEKVGNLKESLLHYFITLPDIMMAQDKFDTDMRIKLLNTTYDLEHNSPLLVLAKLYGHEFKRTHYESLKACFDIILDFGDDSAYSAADIFKSKKEIHSVFETVLAYHKKVFQQDKKTVRDYLKILALVCVHMNDRENYYNSILELFKPLQIKAFYYTLFTKYYKEYTKPEEIALNNEIKFLQENSISLSRILSRNVSPSFLQHTGENQPITPQDGKKYLSDEKPDDQVFNVSHTL